MTEESRDVTLFDVDSTLGDFSPGKIGLYPGVVNFLRLQAEKRRLYTASNSGDGGSKRIGEARQFFEACFGSNEVNSSKIHYIREDGMPRLMANDYIMRFDVQTEEIQALVKENERLGDLLLTDEHFMVESEAANELRRKYAELSQCLDVYVHKLTGELFDESTVYQNPNIRGSFKDLLLAKRIVSPQSYQELRTVMVGDYGDISTVFSDPETPLIVVNNTQRQGDWNPVTVMLDLLYAREEKPFQVFDEMYNNSVTITQDDNLDINGDLVKILDNKSFSSQGMNFVLAKSDRETRYVLLH
jgi:hypothetical protein